MNDLEIRHFRPEDYDPLGDLLDAIYPDYPGQLGDVRHADETRAAHCRAERWVIFDSGRMLACAEYDQPAWHYHPRKFQVEVLVHPEGEGNGLGSRLYQNLEAALAPFDPIALTAFVRDDKIRGIGFAEALAFREQMREIESHLDLETYDPEAGRPVRERVRAQGIVIKSLPELAGDPDRDRKLYELRTAVMKDVPAVAAYTDEGFEQWAKRFFNDPAHLPEAVIVALSGERHVGLLTLLDSDGAPVLYTGLTGTHGDFRGRGIAQALKHYSLAWAQSVGRKKVMTWNESANQGILAINRQVGFVAQSAWITFLRQIQPDPELP